ncbi:hypothetical protein [Butyrivibrio sp. INlla16]|uniref:hypothetical protein n=1 Tax=Butyrivibrio sp. INlla16 TaxID=1520807 RepID=UPI000B83E4B2|nr:hypothetical protein [Butyrivibrio sp. INlla16]
MKCNEVYEENAPEVESGKQKKFTEFPVHQKIESTPRVHQISESNMKYNGAKIKNLKELKSDVMKDNGAK